MDKTWADRLVFSFNYSHFYKEIQTGVYQYVVFGQKHRKGYSFVPSVEYRKRNLLIEGLDISATANYNHNITHNIDTAAYKYNWLGDKNIPVHRENSRIRIMNQKYELEWNIYSQLPYRRSTYFHPEPCNQYLSPYYTFIYLGKLQAV